MGYKPGEEILKGEKPFSHIIASRYRSQFCDWCIKEEKSGHKLKKCTGCREVYYCNPLCQKEAYITYHKEECQKLKKIPSDMQQEVKKVMILMGRTITRSMVL